MLSFLFLASIPAAISSASLAAEEAGQQAVTQSANGEFLSKNYPPKALKNGEQGRVGFRLVIESDGSLGTCEVTQSSGFRTLDNETCEVILRNARLKPVRNEEGRAVRAVQNGYINWKLPSGAAKTAGLTGTKAAGRDPEKIICKRSQSTGSLVRKTKQCMTARQWAENARIQRDEVERIVGTGHFEDEGGQ